MHDLFSQDWTLPSRLDAVGSILKEIVSNTKNLGWDEDACFAIHLALDEALANAIEHGNQGVEERDVNLKVNVTPERFEAVVQDQGSGFSPMDVPDPTDDANLLRPCGRGVMLMQAYMTEVSFNARGNEVTLVRLAEVDS